MTIILEATVPLVSVIIPCYNHACFLDDAIASAVGQNYDSMEVIVVDDGSSDNTREVATKYNGVKYVYQTNQGLSAARNKGIALSRGEFLVFLDADDWLLPDAIVTNISFLSKDSHLAFVSGGHTKVYMQEGNTEESITEVKAEHYKNLLRGNYIGMHATVMYRRFVFDELMFDTSLKYCEDYDLYLKVARRYQVLHHTQKIAAYRIHSSNMSSDTSAMLQSVLAVLRRQKGFLRNEQEKAAYNEGKVNWQAYYFHVLYAGLRKEDAKVSFRQLNKLARYMPNTFIRYFGKISLDKLKQGVRSRAPEKGLRLLHHLGLYENYRPRVGLVNLGDFKSLTPISTDFGYDRGGPVDRYYVENFLERESQSIMGHVLEIGDNAYTLRFGRDKVSISDVLDIDTSNTKANLLGDICHLPQIPDNYFDCIILTQTLHFIYNVKEALNTCYRTLKPGGALLLTVPGITPIDHGEWKETWFWAFTDRSMKKLMADTFPDGSFEVKDYGNVFAATAFLNGLGLPELPKEKLDYHDPHYQVIITVKATKPLTA